MKYHYQSAKAWKPCVSPACEEEWRNESLLLDQGQRFFCLILYLARGLLFPWVTFSHRKSRYARQSNVKSSAVKDWKPSVDLRLEKGVFYRLKCQTTRTFAPWYCVGFQSHRLFYLVTTNKRVLAIQSWRFCWEAIKSLYDSLKCSGIGAIFSFSTSGELSEHSSHKLHFGNPEIWVIALSRDAWEEKNRLGAVFSGIEYQLFVVMISW